MQGDNTVAIALGIQAACSAPLGTCLAAAAFVFVFVKVNGTLHLSLLPSHYLPRVSPAPLSNQSDLNSKP
ncbi:hypothetical protein Ahy_A06g027643 isoform E [Arachis hypogaea]|uniref:Uncharacterized protein n=1 Tax=Arachis hypogaea TaxID=3818 RepID=A0A445CPC3_ARAHY|nr:hypothetical protein Ahy_A06g027643 isoform E [Arachis hypogaea]